MTNPPTAVVAAPPKPMIAATGEFMWDLVTPSFYAWVLSRLDLVELEAFCRVYERWKGMSRDDRWWN